MPDPPVKSPELFGSGKFGTPWVRMHWENLRIACVYEGELAPLFDPAGSKL